MITLKNLIYLINYHNFPNPPDNLIVDPRCYDVVSCVLILDRNDPLFISPFTSKLGISYLVVSDSL